MITTAHIEALAAARREDPTTGIARAMLAAVKPITEWAAEPHREPSVALAWLVGVLALIGRAGLTKAEAMAERDRLDLDQVQDLVLKSYQ